MMPELDYGDIFEQPTVGEWFATLSTPQKVFFNIFSNLSGGRLDFALFRLLGYNRQQRKHK